MGNIITPGSISTPSRVEAKETTTETLSTNSVEVKETSLLKGEVIVGDGEDTTSINNGKIVGSEAIFKSLQISDNIKIDKGITIDGVDIKDFVKNSVKEETDRAVEKETELEDKLTNETSDRETADTNLQSNIDIEKNRITAEITRATEAEKVLTTNLTQEIADRKEADKNLDDKITDLDTNLTTEITNRTNADTELQTAIDNEIDRAEAKEDELNSVITTEVADRKTAITAEEKARGDKDTELEGLITTEITRAKEAETNLETALTGKINDVNTDLINHKEDKANPHEVTKSQVGLSNVDNTSDADKPVSTAQEAAISTAKSEAIKDSKEYTDGEVTKVNNKINEMDFISEGGLNSKTLTSLKQIDGKITEAIFEDIDITTSQISNFAEEFDKKLDKTGGSISGNLTIEKDLTINGKVNTVEAQTLKVADKIIELAKDNTVSLTSPAGIVVPKYDGENTGGIIYTNTGEARVGKVVVDENGIITDHGETQALLTRDNDVAMVNSKLIEWDSENKKAISSNKSIQDIETDIESAIESVRQDIPTDYLTGGSQTSTSEEDEGENIFTFTKSTGETATFTIKNGSKGSKGDKGDKGDPGEQGPQGADGATGKDGKAATIAIGTVTTGDPDTEAVITNSGDISAAVFNFTIPKGSKGEDGAPGKDGKGIAEIHAGSHTSTDIETRTNLSIKYTDDVTDIFTIYAQNGKEGPQGPEGPSGVVATAVGTTTGTLDSGVVISLSYDSTTKTVKYNTAPMSSLNIDDGEL